MISATPIREALGLAGFQDGERYELAAFADPPSGRGAPKAERFEMREERDALAWLRTRAREQAEAHAAGRAVKGGLYIGTNPLRDGNGRAADADVEALRVLLVDVDTRDHRLDDEARAAAAATGDEIAEQLGGAAAVVDSGVGRQLWLRHEPLAVDDPRAELRKRLLAALARRFDGPLAHVDTSVANPSRLMRLPAGVNLRSGAAPRVLRRPTAPPLSVAALERLVVDLEHAEAGAAPSEAPGEPDHEEARDDRPDGPELPAFPVDALPEVVQGVIDAHARAVEAPLELAALPAMAAMAAALGPTWRVAATPGFVRAPLLWIVSVAPPGSGKGLTARPLFEPIKAAHRRLREEHELQVAEWERAQAGKKKDEVQGDRPRRRRALVTSATIEALLGVLQDADGHGVLLHSDEVRTLLDGLDGYRARGSQGRGQWLTLWDGQYTDMIRKQAESAEVDNPFVAVFGGVQPLVLSKLQLSHGDGLMPRFLWAHSVTGERSLGAGVDPRVADLWGRMIGLALAHRVLEPQPFTREALDRFNVAHRAWTRRGAELARDGRGLLSELLAKAGDQAGRLVALLHGFEAVERAVEAHAVDPPPLEATPVTLQTVERALRLVDYFMAHGAHAARLVTLTDGRPARTGDAQIQDALRRIVVPGNRITDTPTGWAKRLGGAGVELSPDAVGRRFGNLQIPAFTIERDVRAGVRGWTIARSA